MIMDIFLRKIYWRINQTNRVDSLAKFVSRLFKACRVNIIRSIAWKFSPVKRKRRRRKRVERRRRQRLDGRWFRNPRRNRMCKVS